MVTNKDQLRFHPVAHILRDRILLDVAEENDKIAEESSRRESLRDFLGVIELRLDGDCIASTSINRSAVIKHPHGHPFKTQPDGHPYLCVPIDCAPLPLSDFLAGRVAISGQDFASFSEVDNELLSVDDGYDSIRLKVRLALFSFVEGEIRGLRKADVMRLRGALDGGEQMRHITSSITFVPDKLFHIITPQFQKTLRLFGPLPTFYRIEDVDGEPLPMGPSDIINCPTLSSSEGSRLDIVSALGCTDSQMEVLDNNHRLKYVQFRLTKVEERLGAVEILHTAGTGNIKLSLKDGELCEGSRGPYWLIPIQETQEHALVACSELWLLKCCVSGICTQLGSMRVGVDPDGSYFFTREFLNGAKITGQFDSESIQGMDAVEIARNLSRAMPGVQPSFSASKTKLCFVTFPLDSVQNVLNVLGVKVGEA